MFATFTSFAKEKTSAEKAKEKTEEMQKNLGLTAEQNKKIYEINLKTYTSIDDYEAKNDNKKLRKKQKDIMQDKRKDEFKKVLTAPQYKKYEEIKKAEKAKEKAEEQALEKLKKSK